MKAVCVDGPLRGRVVDMGQFPCPISTVPMPESITEDIPQPVTYQPRKFGFTSGGFTVLLWVMVTDAEPAADALADILLSDVAKEAMIRE